MSEENVEAVEAFYAAFERRDDASILKLLDPDVEWDTTARIDGRLTHGIEAMRASMEEGFSSFDRVRIEPEEMQQAGDQVAVRLRGWFRGASSGVESKDRFRNSRRMSHKGHRREVPPRPLKRVLRRREIDQGR
jgi:ketosteroid isomerase-like protein